MDTTVNAVPAFGTIIQVVVVSSSAAREKSERTKMIGTHPNPNASELGRFASLALHSTYTTLGPYCMGQFMRTSRRPTKEGGFGPCRLLVNVAYRYWSSSDRNRLHGLINSTASIVFHSHSIIDLYHHEEKKESSAMVLIGMVDASAATSERTTSESSISLQAQQETTARSSSRYT
eukprot:scaffold84316_cov54-Attheya_sp.AAC.3